MYYNYYDLQMLVFKVWTGSRRNKTTICVKDTENVFQHLLQKCNEKLGITGTKFVLEEDGSIIEDDDVFLYYATEQKVFLLLETSENWQSSTVSHELNIATEPENDSRDLETADVAPNDNNDQENPPQEGIFKVFLYHFFRFTHFIIMFLRFFKMFSAILKIKKRT